MRRGALSHFYGDVIPPPLFFPSFLKKQILARPLERHAKFSSSPYEDANHVSNLISPLISFPTLTFTTWISCHSLVVSYNSNLKVPHVSLYHDRLLSFADFHAVDDNTGTNSETGRYDWAGWLANASVIWAGRSMKGGKNPVANPLRHASIL